MSLGKNIFQTGAEGWGPFTSFAIKAQGKADKQKAQVELQRQEQEFIRQQKVARSNREAAAMEQLRAKIVAKVTQIEAQAISAAEQMVLARQLASDPELQGDQILDQVDAQIADLEQAVVAVQTGTVIDVASFDTNALAVSYGDAQAALVAMNAIQNRATGVVKALQNQIVRSKKERIRAEQLRRERLDQQARDQRRAEQERQERQRIAAREAEDRERVLRVQAMREISDLDTKILAERRALRSARYALETYKQETSERAAKEAEFQIRLQSLRSR